MAVPDTSSSLDTIKDLLSQLQDAVDQLDSEEPGEGEGEAAGVGRRSVPAQTPRLVLVAVNFEFTRAPPAHAEPADRRCTLNACRF